MQVWPLPAVEELHAYQSEKVFIQLLKATIIPIGNIVTTQELADGLQACFLLCLRPTAGAKPFRDHFPPNGPRARAQALAWTCI